MAGTIELGRMVGTELGIDFVRGREVVEATIEAIKKVMAEGGVVSLRGFGNFKMKTTAPRMGRNPQTGEPVPIPAKTKLTFKVSKP